MGSTEKLILKPLTRDEVVIEVVAEPETIPVRGNAIASGDDGFDQQVEDEILARLERGDLWAWAMVMVTVHWKDFSASDYLGCCCYTDETDFRDSGGYFEDMVEQAIGELNRVVLDVHRHLKTRELAS